MELCEEVGKEEMIEDLVCLCDAERVEGVVARMRGAPEGERKLLPIYKSVMEEDGGPAAA